MRVFSTKAALIGAMFFSVSALAAVDSHISVIESGAETPVRQVGSADYQIQWNRIFKLADHPTEQNKKAVVKALKSDDWYLRDSALHVLPKFSVADARTWARKLLDDPALVVRTSAVQVLAEVQTEEDRALFWKKLISKENFHGGQSLWIRRHLVRALAMNPISSEKPKFEALLKDPDSRLYPAAHQALDRISIRDLCVTKSDQASALGGCDIK